MMMMMMTEDACPDLLCDEELMFTSPSPSPARSDHDEKFISATDQSPLLFHGASANEDSETVIQGYLKRESRYRPQSGYAQKLSQSSLLSNARFRAMGWIISACSRHSLSIETVFMATNYLDRFISMNCSIEWQGWMVELLSITCLSIASKLEEVSSPSLHGFQTEDFDHSFQPSTIQRMELAVLKALGWRLTCPTPYSYAHLLASRLCAAHAAAVTARTAELLHAALLDIRLVEHGAFAIAMSAVKRGVKELLPHGSDGYLCALDRLIPDERQAEVEECRKIMGEAVAAWEKRRCCGPASPVTVIPTRRTEVMDCHVDISGCFTAHREEKMSKA